LTCEVLHEWQPTGDSGCRSATYDRREPRQPIEGGDQTSSSRPIGRRCPVHARGEKRVCKETNGRRVVTRRMGRRPRRRASLIRTSTGSDERTGVGSVVGAIATSAPSMLVLYG
jgi:hypothetical protein